MRRLRCLLGWHGPRYTTGLYGTGPYSTALPNWVRLCPFCQTRWRCYGTLDQWRKVPPDSADIDWIKP